MKNNDFLIIQFRKTTEKLLACPFCGSTDIEIQNTHTACYWAECVCGVTTKSVPFNFKAYDRKSELNAHKDSFNAAVWYWNERART